MDQLLFFLETLRYPEEIVERGGDYIRAVAKLEDRLIILIDLGRALAHELREAPSATGA